MLSSLMAMHCPHGDVLLAAGAGTQQFAADLLAQGSMVAGVSNAALAGNGQALPLTLVSGLCCTSMVPGISLLGIGASTCVHLMHVCKQELSPTANATLMWNLTWCLPDHLPQGKTQSDLTSAVSSSSR